MGSRSKMFDCEGNLRTLTGATEGHAYWGFAVKGQDAAMKYALKRKFHPARVTTLKKLSKLRRIAIDRPADPLLWLSSLLMPPSTS